MPHALLVTGPAGVGKRHFAEQLVQGRLCQSPDAAGVACGDCPACRQFHAGSHPDWKNVGIEAKRKNIVIDQIRAVTEWLGLTASAAHGKHLLIEPAERMTVGAANSLLKTLEEPAGDALILLVSRLPGKLTATIRSRCRQIPLARPATEDALDWLKHYDGKVDWREVLALADGSPLRAISLHDSGGVARARENAAQAMALGLGRESLVRVAEQWSRQDIAAVLTWYRVWLEALARRGQGGPAHAEGLLDEDNRELQKLLRRIDWKALHELMLDIQRAEQRLDSANPQLLLESLLGKWVSACRDTTTNTVSEAGQ